MADLDSLKQLILSNNIGQITRDNVIIQAPDILIYKNNINVFKGGAPLEAADYEIMSLPFNQEVADFRLISLTINADTNPNPHTASLQFAIPTAQNDTKVTYVTELDLPNEMDKWYLMDRVEIWISPNKGVLPYIRSFVGCVTSLSYEIREYQFIFTVQLKDMMFWLDQARVQTNWSMFDLALRRPQYITDPKDTSKWMIYSNRFAGLNFRHLIEKVLFNRKVKDLPYSAIAGSKVEGNPKEYDLYENEEFNLLPVYSAGEMYAILASVGINQSPVAELPYSSKFRNAVVNSIQNAPGGAIAKQLPQGSDSTKLGINANVIAQKVKSVDSNPPLQVNDIAFGFVENVAEAEELRAMQIRNQKAMSLYWEFAFFSYIRENYISLIREDDIALMPFPWESDSNSLVLYEGKFSSRGQIIRQLSEQTLYEIYQSNQGFIFVKPPLYNAPPINNIQASEISDIVKQENIDPVLTSATTEGIIDWKTMDKEMPQVTIPKNEYPFVLGAYQILFPKNFKLETPENFDFRDDALAFRVPIDSVPAYTQIWIQLQNENDRFVKDSLVLKLKEEVKSNGQIVKLDPLVGEKPQVLINVMLWKFYYKVLDPVQISALNSGLNAQIFYLEFSTKGRTVGTVVALDLFFAFIEEWLLAHMKDFGISDPVQIRKINYNIYTKIKQILDTNRVNTNKESGEISNQAVVEEERQNEIEKFNNNDLYQTIISSFSPTTSGSFSLMERFFISPGGYQSVDAYVEATFSYKKINLDPSYKQENAQWISEEVRRVHPSNLEKPTVLILIGGILAAESYKLKSYSTGEYNIMQHGFRDVKLNNNLIRSNLGASVFSKYYLYKNNVQAKTYTFTLQTLRPNIVPGFPILNTIDGCVYYVQSIALSLTAGESTQTTVTCVARRRPLFGLTDYVIEEGILGDANNYLEALSTWEQYSEETLDGLPIFTTSLEAASNPAYTFLGWEMYGPSDNDLGEIFTNASGIFLPPFGGYLTADLAGLVKTGLEDLDTTMSIVFYGYDEKTGYFYRFGLLPSDYFGPGAPRGTVLWDEDPALFASARNKDTYIFGWNPASPGIRKEGEIFITPIIDFRGQDILFVYKDEGTEINPTVKVVGLENNNRVIKYSVTKLHIIEPKQLESILKKTTYLSDKENSYLSGTFEGNVSTLERQDLTTAYNPTLYYRRIAMINDLVSKQEATISKLPKKWVGNKKGGNTNG